MYTPLSQNMPRAVQSSASREGDLYGRIDRLQTLFEELQREVAAGAGETNESVRAAELRGRIADLMTEEAAISTTTTSGGRGTTVRSTLLTMSDVGTLPPPAYEQG